MISTEMVYGVGAIPDPAARVDPVAGAPGPASPSGGGGLSGIISMIKNAAILNIAGSVGYLLGWMASAFFALGGYLVKLAVNVNKDILSSPIVTIGWNIVLNITNLGFILAIIVIAFATIFRLESYGMKKTLGRLIAAALLVNFSLVIAGVFINVSDVFTEYLKNQTAGAGPQAFGTAFAGIFKVQALLNTDTLIQSTSNADVPGIIGNFASGTLGFVSSIFFVAIFTFLGALALLATAIMLFVRYVVLGILLILAPIVWLFWIFPATQSHWKKWWTTFFEWVFFPPLVLFFLYLAIYTLQGQGPYFEELRRASEGGQLAHLYSGLSVIGNLVIAFGLVFGGLITAKKLSGSGGAMMYGWAERAGKGIGRGVGGWAGRKGMQYGGGLARIKGAGGKSLAERTTDWATNRKNRVTRFLAGGIASPIAKLSRISGEDLVKKAEGRIKNLNTMEKKARLNTADAPTKIALLKSLAADQDLDGVNMPIIRTTEMRNTFARFQQGKAFSDFEKTSGASVEMQEAAKAKDMVRLREATDKFIKSLSFKDLGKTQWNDVFSKEPKFGLDGETHRLLKEDLAAGFTEILPGAFSKITSNIKPNNFDSYEDLVKYQIYQLKAKDAVKGQTAENVFNANIGWRTMGRLLETGDTVPPPPAATATPTT
ncbi:hypothetical protein HY504_00270 [Candidatus Wolfebacteria bacterium]|nr:hypothetical protein [Candidatus Wolfebacteria bacterium]